MNKAQRKVAAAEWKQILKDHSSFSRVFLSQQAILMEAAQLGSRVVDRGMHRLLKSGLPVLFEDFWAVTSEEIVGEIYVSPMIECLTELNRDPARCFNLDQDDQSWFDDPLAGGRVLPPKPPIPPLRPRE